MGKPYSTSIKAVMRQYLAEGKSKQGMEARMPQKGMAGPVRIGHLMEPLREIAGHPDRDGIMAALFKDYK